MLRRHTLGDLTDAKLNVLKRQGRADEYLALCQQTGRQLRYALMLCDMERVPETIRYAQKHLASADEAHQPFQEVPDEWNSHVDAFWSEIEARAEIRLGERA